MVNITRILRHSMTLAMLLSSSICQAENLALLVGISDYPDLYQLEGPQFDVKAIDKALREKWSFPSNNINILLNDNATKQNMLQAIDQLYEKSKAGDNIFIYLSGHGTSQFDSELNLPLPHTTGAFIPYGEYSKDDEGELLQQLIIGTRDLRPRLEKFDSGNRHLFVVVDACYSGSTIRGKFSGRQLPTRYVNLFTKYTKNFSNKSAQLQESIKKRSADSVFKANSLSKEDDIYPYKNIYYLGAASQYEKAVDISAEWLDKYPTIDGNPHGAFTDSLLRVLDKPLSVDVNNNGKVAYMELKQGVSDILQARHINHTPQSLPLLSEDKNRLNRKEVFFMRSKSMLLAAADTATHDVRVVPAATPAKVKLSKLNKERVIVSAPADLKPKIKTQLPNPDQLPDITFNKGKANISVINNDNEYVFSNPSGDMIYRQDVGNTADYVKQIKYLTWLEKVQLLLDSSKQKMVGEMQGVGRGLSLVEGDSIGFTLYPSAGGYLIIVNFTSTGEINLLYPAVKEEDIRYQPNTLVRKHDFAQVTTPFGRETVYALMFDEKLELPEHLLGASFSFNHQYAAELLHLLTQKQNAMRVKKFTFYTGAKDASSQKQVTLRGN